MSSYHTTPDIPASTARCAFHDTFHVPCAIIEESAKSAIAFNAPGIVYSRRKRSNPSRGIVRPSKVDCGRNVRRITAPETREKRSHTRERRSLNDTESFHTHRHAAKTVRHSPTPKRLATVDADRAWHRECIVWRPERDATETDGRPVNSPTRRLYSAHFLGSLGSHTAHACAG